MRVLDNMQERFTASLDGAFAAYDERVAAGTQPLGQPRARVLGARVHPAEVVLERAEGQADVVLTGATVERKPDGSFVVEAKPEPEPEPEPDPYTPPERKSEPKHVQVTVQRRGSPPSRFGGWWKGALVAVLAVLVAIWRLRARRRLAQ